MRRECHFGFQSRQLIGGCNEQRFVLLPKENYCEGERRPGPARSGTLSDDSCTLNRTEWLAFDSIGISIENEERGTEL